MRKVVEMRNNIMSIEGVSDAIRNNRDGDFLEVIGTYHDYRGECSGYFKLQRLNNRGDYAFIEIGNLRQFLASSGSIEEQIGMIVKKEGGEVFVFTDSEDYLDFLNENLNEFYRQEG